MAEPQPEWERLDMFRQAVGGILAGAHETGSLNDIGFITAYGTIMASARAHFYDEDPAQAIDEEFRAMNGPESIIRFSPN